MIFRESESSEEVSLFDFKSQVIIAAFSVPVVLLGIFWEKILVVANGAKLFIQ